MKICSRCKLEKELDQFYKKKTGRDGHEARCKECMKRNCNIEQIKDTTKKCSKCLLYKDLSLFKRYSVCIDCSIIINKIYNDSKKEKMKEYYENNKEFFKDRSKTYYKNNKEYVIDRNSKYYEDNKTKMNNYKNNYKNNKCKTDKIFKLKCNITSLISVSISKMGYNKNSKTRIILGCDYDFFKEYIENQFTEGMTWENYPEWHLDHKKPISWAETEEEVYELNHYTNFQPLWEKDNLSKGNRYSD